MYGSVFQPLMSSYTAMRGYHCAISNNAPSRPMRPAPYGGTLNDQTASMSTDAPCASGAGSVTFINVPKTECFNAVPPDVTAPSCTPPLNLRQEKSNTAS